MLETLLRVVRKLQEHDIAYMVVGSVAAMVYGEPRLTHDMDVVIDVAPGDAKKLALLFPDEEYYCPPLDVVRTEIVHRSQFNIIHHESGLKIDFVIRKATEHGVTEFARRRPVPLAPGQAVYLASPEDVILKKLDYFRQGGSEKHLKDIRGILAETEIDYEYLRAWLVKLGLQGEWEMVG